jgi:hypothetical protein
VRRSVGDIAAGERGADRLISLNGTPCRSISACGMDGR